jgi:peptide/nickel transport system permease protein
LNESGIWLTLSSTKGRVGFGILLALVAIALVSPYVVPSPERAYGQYLPPSAKHLLGTDYFGYNVLSWVLIGSRVSLLVGFLAGAAITAIALAMAVIAGYFEKTILGELFSAIINVFLVIPALPLLIVIASYIVTQSVYPVIFAIVIISWPYPARILRSQILTLKNREFVLADKGLGLSDFQIIRSDILPSLYSIIFSVFLFGTIGAILTQASLQFLGLGGVSIVSWGSMLYWAQNEEALFSGAWWWFLPPGIMIGLVGVALVLINLSLDEVVNPRLQALKLSKKAKEIQKTFAAS